MKALTPTVPSRAIPWKGIGLVILVVALFIVGRMLPLNAGLKQFNAWISGIGPLGVLIYVLAYAVAAVLFVPGSVLTIGAGFVFGIVWGTVAVSLGSTLAAAAAFLIARYIARDKISSWARKNRKFEAIDSAIGKQGWKIVALLRLSPVIPFSLSNYLYGLTAVPFWPYIIASWVAMLPGTVLYVYLGVAGKAGLEAAAGAHSAAHSLQTTLLVAGLVATFIVTWFVSRIAKKALQNTQLDEAKEK